MGVRQTPRRLLTGHSHQLELMRLRLRGLTLLLHDICFCLVHRSQCALDGSLRRLLQRNLDIAPPEVMDLSMHGGQLEHLHRLFGHRRMIHRQVDTFLKHTVRKLPRSHSVDA